MAETTEIKNEAVTDERSSEEIRQNIVAKEESISETVEEVSEKIQEKLDWRAYVGQYPYLALGIATGIGFLASGMLPRGPTAMERITGTIGEEMGNLVSGLLRGVGRTAFRSSLWGLAATIAVGLAKRAATEAILGSGSGDSSIPQRKATPQQEAA